MGSILFSQILNHHPMVTAQWLPVGKMYITFCRIVLGYLSTWKESLLYVSLDIRLLYLPTLKGAMHGSSAGSYHIQIQAGFTMKDRRLQPSSYFSILICVFLCRFSVKSKRDV